ncbi:MAG: hypothetical protein EA412_07780 [Chitinophagaceae bacterium]|nr:MAG: hypothetical protein EA412_07780 [Chitinophagaceae bacterium]
MIGNINKLKPGIRNILIGLSLILAFGVAANIEMQNFLMTAGLFFLVFLGYWLIIIAITSIFLNKD